jgi:hypothetical protein
MRDIGRWLVLQVGRASVAAWAIASFVFILSRIAAVGPAETLFDEADGGVTLTSRADASASRNQARQTLKERLGLAEPVFYFTRTGTPPQSGIGTAPTINTTTGLVACCTASWGFRFVMDSPWLLGWGQHSLIPYPSRG